VIPGHATPEATAAFAAGRVKEGGIATGNYRTARGLTLSSIGLGTYLGEADDATDRAYADAVVEFVRRGGNLLDTAINYRAQRSERAVGAALARLANEHAARRDALLVCTKVGYFSFEGVYPRNQTESRAWVESQFVATGIVRDDDIAQGCHAMTPDYIRHQSQQSRANLGLETIDVYYLHNPETQLRERDIDREEFTTRMRAAFETMEELASGGAIRNYGLATWNGFRVPPSSEDYLSLEDLVGLAKSIAGEGHHLRFIQAPLNLAMLEAVRFANQRVGTRLLPLFEAARALDLYCVASASLYQKRLCENLPPQIAELFPGFSSDAQRAIQFNRSAPNVTTALVGMSRAEHVAENLAVTKRPPAPVEATKKLLLKLA
jgi:aryl-alcohol dehydrogenase-like predicted oxidoreductase